MKKFKLDPLFLKRNDIEKLKLIGYGKDANVYDAKNGLLYKIYHKNLLGPHNIFAGAIYDIDGVRIDKPLMSENFKTNYLTYIDKDNIKLFSFLAINGAIKKQEFVDNTFLPLAPIYINNHFEGCVLKYHKYYIGIHNICIGPTILKLKVLKEVLNNVSELLNNNIYHIDLDNKKINNETHSNILISPLGNVEIIDIDGRSAVYRETKSDLLYELSINSCATLFYEILFDLDIHDEIIDNDRDYIEYTLKKEHLPNEFINAYLNGNNTIETLDKMLQYIKVKKK